MVEWECQLLGERQGMTTSEHGRLHMNHGPAARPFIILAAKDVVSETDAREAEMSRK